MNGQFEYVMGLISILIGLGLTHILSALGLAVHRLRGHGAPIRLEPTYLLWVAFLIVWMVSFWWWEFLFRDFARQWTFGLYLFLIFYAVVLFLMAVILVPKDMEGLDDSYAYFMSGRRWFFSVFLLANFLDVVDSLLKSVDKALTTGYVAMEASFIIGGIVGMLTERRGVQLALAIVLFTYQVIYTWQALDVLGTW